MNEIEHLFIHLRPTVFLFSVWSFIFFAHVSIGLLVGFCFCFISKSSLYKSSLLHFATMQVAKISPNFTLFYDFAYSIFAMWGYFLFNVVKYINLFGVCGCWNLVIDKNIFPL